LATIGYATLQIIPSLQGVTDAIEKQVEGKAVSVTIEPKVDEPAAEKAGKKARETVEKHTKEVKVEPKVDQKAAEDAGKKTGEAVAKGASASSTAIGGFIVGALQGAGGEAGQRLGEKLADSIPTGLTGAAERIGTALRNSLPTVGASAGTMLGSAIGVALTNAIGKERLDKAGIAIKNGLTKAVGIANTGVDIGVSIGNKVATGLTSASGVIGGAAAGLTNIIGGIGDGIETAKQLLGGNDSWAAPGLDALNGLLGNAAPLLSGLNSAAALAAGGAELLSAATTIATTVQTGFNIALDANPIGLIVLAIAALVAGLVYFFTQTEIGRKIWEGFTEYLKIAWEGIKIAFGAAWDVIKAIFSGMVDGAQVVWDGIKAAFTGVVDFVKGLPNAIGSAASGMWDGIANAFKSMIDKLKGWWNGFASAISFTTPDFLPGDPVTFSLPKFSGGGYTGNGAADQPAGFVHGGEYVIKASSTSGIQNAMPGLLDYLNSTGRLPMPGYEGGGIVALGNISGAGITTGEQQSMWDAVRGKFPAAVLNSATRSVMTEGHPDYHNSGRAIDIGGPNMGAIASWIASTYPESLELIHSPFSKNIKNGKDVGDGNSFYGADLMAAHGNHVHWALGKAAASSAQKSAPLASAEASAQAPAAASTSATADTGTSSTGISLASSFSGLAGSGFDALGNGAVSKPGQRDPGAYFPDAASAAVSGQVSSALGAFGVGDSPGFLKGLSAFASGIKIGGGSSGIAPISAAPAVSAASGAIGGVTNGGSGQQAPAVVYNIATTDIEPAYLASQRQERERAAANLAAI
jgi:hypothetical protein